MALLDDKAVQGGLMALLGGMADPSRASQFSNQLIQAGLQGQQNKRRTLQDQLLEEQLKRQQQSRSALDQLAFMNTPEAQLPMSRFAGMTPEQMQGEKMSLMTQADPTFGLKMMQQGMLPQITKTPDSLLSKGMMWADPSDPRKGVTELPGYTKGADLKQSDIAGVRKEAAKYVDIYKEREQAFKALQKTASDPDVKARAANDVAMIFQFMKMLDPGSVVREGEQIMVQRTDGLFGYWGNKLRQAQGGQSLNQDQRDGLVLSAANSMESAYDVYKDRHGFYEGVATRSGMNPRNIIPELSVSPLESLNFSKAEQPPFPGLGDTSNPMARPPLSSFMR